MKSFKVWFPAVVIVAIGTGLVVFYLMASSVIDLSSSAESAELAKSEATGRGQFIFTSFKSPWQLPELKFMNRKNREISLEPFRGSHVLLNIWATWCAPCREEMPALDRLQEKMGGPDFHVLPLSIDEAHPAVIRKFYEELGIKFLYVYQDPTGSAFSKLNLTAIPATILLDNDGSGIGYVVGAVEWDSPDTVREIRSYLAN